MDRLAYENLEIIWDYMHLHMEPRPADCIVGFGNYNTAIALRAAELYHQKLAPKILFWAATPTAAGPAARRPGFGTSP